MAINLTPAALAHARKFVHGGNAIGLRFGIKRTGCSGWGYVVELAQAVRADASVFDVDGLQVLIDAHSLPLVDGPRIDYEIGRASCRDRVCQYVSISVVTES